MNREISYTIKRSKKAKRMRITVYRNGDVIVTSPFIMRQSIIEEFVHNKINWIYKKIQFFNSIDNKSIRIFSYKDYLENKNKAFIFVNNKIKFYNKIYNFPFNKICIKNQKNSWGSCSYKKNLNLNYKIIFLPVELQNYIIVHEICHLKELNHSKKFWALVKKTLPDYIETRKELHEH